MAEDRTAATMPTRNESSRAIARLKRTGYYWRRFGLRRSFNSERVYLTLWLRRGRVGAETVGFLLNMRIPRGLRPRA